MSAREMTPELLLPWESSAQDDQRFRTILRNAMAVFFLIAVAMPWLPVAERVLVNVVEEQPPLAHVIVRPKVLPQPEPVAAVKRPRPKPQPVEAAKPVKPRPIKSKPVEKPQSKPVDTLAQARKAAALAGVLAFQDDLQELRDRIDVSALDQTQTSRGESSAVKPRRAIVTALTPANSGGIQTAALSADTGGPALSGRKTTGVISKIVDNIRAGKVSSQALQLGGRSDESIRKVMDANKGAIFAIYNRALRQDPLLEGKLVFEMVIDAAGSIQELTLLSSELTDNALAQKILSRITLIRFGQEQVISTRVNYSFDFLPFT